MNGRWGYHLRGHWHSTQGGLAAFTASRPGPVPAGTDRLPDIPQATLYRHIAVLADAEVLEVADERRVRGAVERSYRLRRENAVLDPATMTLEGHQDRKSVV